jgi:hypothetical protein
MTLSAEVGLVITPTKQSILAASWFGCCCCFIGRTERDEEHFGGLGMKFSRWDENGTKIEMEVHNESTIDEVLEEFQNFLRACGYVIDYNQRLVLEDMDQ